MILVRSASEEPAHIVHDCVSARPNTTMVGIDRLVPVSDGGLGIGEIVLHVTKRDRRDYPEFCIRGLFWFTG